MQHAVPNAVNPPPAAIEILYDDECPLCRTYCRNLKLDDATRPLSLLDARKGGALLARATARGMDIDKGMVVTIDGAMHYGSEAIFQLSKHARRRGWAALSNRLFFSNRRLARVLYPLSKMARNIVLRLMGVEDIDNLKPKNTLKHQLGAAWQSLDPQVQARFDREPETGEVITYEGVMHVIRRSRMGWLFATLTRLIGNPLTPFAGTDVPMEVSLSRRADNDGVFWQRSYFYPGRAPYVVTSVKRESKAGEMLECVGGGFGMKLNVTAENGEMHFRSYRYFWRFLGYYKMPLPHWLSPGLTHVVHKDLGGGNFMFSITINHRQLGETFFQQGVFRLKTAKAKH